MSIELFPLYKMLNDLPDEPDENDKESMQKAKTLIKLYSYEGLPVPEKLIEYQELLLASPPITGTVCTRARVMAARILQVKCGYSRDDAYEAIIERDGLHIAPESLYTSGHKISRIEVFKYVKSRYEIFRPISAEELKTKVLR